MKTVEIFYTQDWNLGQELFVHLPLPDGRAHQDSPVRVAVDAPQLDVRGGFYGGRARGAVDEGELTEGTTLADVQDLFAVDVDFYFAVVDDVEVVTLVALLNDHFALE